MSGQLENKKEPISGREMGRGVSNAASSAVIDLSETSGPSHRGQVEPTEKKDLINTKPVAEEVKAQANLSSFSGVGIANIFEKTQTPSIEVKLPPIVPSNPIEKSISQSDKLIQARNLSLEEKLGLNKDSQAVQIHNRREIAPLKEPGTMNAVRDSVPTLQTSSKTQEPAKTHSATSEQKLEHKTEQKIEQKLGEQKFSAVEKTAPSEKINLVSKPERVAENQADKNVKVVVPRNEIQNPVSNFKSQVNLVEGRGIVPQHVTPSSAMHKTLETKPESIQSKQVTPLADKVIAAKHVSNNTSTEPKVLKNTERPVKENILEKTKSEPISTKLQSKVDATIPIRSKLQSESEKSVQRSVQINQDLTRVVTPSLRSNIQIDYPSQPKLPTRERDEKIQQNRKAESLTVTKQSAQPDQAKISSPVNQTEKQVSFQKLTELRLAVMNLVKAPQIVSVSSAVNQHLRAILSQISEGISARLQASSAGRPLTQQDVESLIPYDLIRKLVSDALIEAKIRERITKADLVGDDKLLKTKPEQTPLERLGQKVLDTIKELLGIETKTLDGLELSEAQPELVIVDENEMQNEQLEETLEEEELLDMHDSNLEEDKYEDEDLLVYEIWGRVVDSKTGAPLSNILLLGGILGQARTDEMGNYKFFNIPSGTSYVISPFTDEYNFNPISVSGVLDKSTRHDFRGKRRLRFASK
jgi:hypothetical protein